MNAPRTPLFVVPPQLAEQAGATFMQRLNAAAARIEPRSAAVALAFAEGPEVSGGLDVEPNDE